MTTYYEYRRGDGNEGEFFQAYVSLEDGDDAFAALKALTINDYIVGTNVRRHLSKHIEIDGESEYTIFGTVYDGPRGERAFGAAYLTSSLRKVKEEEIDQDRLFSKKPVHFRDLLDRGAKMIYTKDKN
jgi:hypothetical protein